MYQGSVVGRSTELTKADDAETVWKDLDLKQEIVLGPLWKSQLLHHLEADCSVIVFLPETQSIYCERVSVFGEDGYHRLQLAIGHEGCCKRDAALQVAVFFLESIFAATSVQKMQLREFARVTWRHVGFKNKLREIATGDASGQFCRSVVDVEKFHPR